MTPETALIELLDRIATNLGAPTLLSTAELAEWPHTAVNVMKAEKLISEAKPARSTVCLGCEQECMMPVHTIPVISGDPGLFIVCDKRDDINRVAVSPDQLEQWQTTGTAVARLLTKLLKLPTQPPNNGNNGRWEIGVLKGLKHTSHLVLWANDRLILSLAGHTLPLAEVLKFEEKRFAVDKSALIQLVDNPIASAGDVESATQRRERLRKRVQEKKNRGVRAFLKEVAEEERISISRLKQIIYK